MNKTTLKAIDDKYKAQEVLIAIVDKHGLGDVMTMLKDYSHMQYTNSSSERQKQLWKDDYLTLESCSPDINN